MNRGCKRRVDLGAELLQGKAVDLHAAFRTGGGAQAAPLAQGRIGADPFVAQALGVFPFFEPDRPVGRP